MHTKKLSRLLAPCLLVLGLGACDRITGPGQSTLIVENASAHTIQIVNFSDCNDPAWGPDRLGSTEVIASGAERAWSVEPGCYDVRARTEAGSQIWWDQKLDRGSTLRLSATTFSASNAQLFSQSGAESLGLKSR